MIDPREEWIQPTEEKGIPDPGKMPFTVQEAFPARTRDCPGSRHRPFNIDDDAADSGAEFPKVSKLKAKKRILESDSESETEINIPVTKKKTKQLLSGSEDDLNLEELEVLPDLTAAAEGLDSPAALQKSFTLRPIEDRLPPPQQILAEVEEREQLCDAVFSRPNSSAAKKKGRARST